MFNELADEIHAINREKGFYEREWVGGVNYGVLNPSLPAEKMMLVVSECAEVLETLRDKDSEHEAEEVADIVIRTLDYASWRGIDLDAEVQKKMETNRARPQLHGRAF